MKQIEKAREIAKHLESVVSERNLHVGLTGGVLYKEGERKDIDLLVYSHKCFELINTSYLASILALKGFTDICNYGRVIECKYTLNDELIDIDILVPESESDEYVEEEANNLMPELPKTNKKITLIHPHNGDEIETTV